MWIHTHFKVSLLGQDRRCHWVWGLSSGLIYSLDSLSCVRSQTQITLCEESSLNSSGIHLVRKKKKHVLCFLLNFPGKTMI